jgi:ribulose 1,5-bisphosphate synthetase/thiazole synthase
MTSSPISRRRFIARTLAASTLPSFPSAAEADNLDICIYGGTASGVMAAVTAVKQGRKAVIVEPSRWLGGMTGGGLSHVDWGREKAVGGTA